MKQDIPNSERGFVLLTVVIAITLVAAIALALSYQGASEANIVSGERQIDQARYAAEAGMAHAKLQLAQNTSCTAYSNLAATPFGPHSYAATVMPVSGSPVSLVATGTQSNGASRVVSRNDVKVFQATTTLILQPDAAIGKDTYVYEWKSAWNYGSASTLAVEDRIAGDHANALFEFDLSTIPTAATILSAAFELDQTSPVGTVGGDFAIHKVTEGWSEGAASGDNGSPNWTERSPGTAWTTVGGDFAAQAVATISFASGVGSHQWDISGLVQDWVSGASPNDGLAVVPASWGTNAVFASSDNSNAALRPKLTVVYACECGKVCGAGTASGTVLLVVGSAFSPSTQDNDKKTLIEAWGYAVTLIDDGASQSEFDTALGVNDVVYVSSDVSATTVGTKLTAATIGIVNEETLLTIELGFSDDTGGESRNEIEILDNTHSITSGFALGMTTIVTSNQPLTFINNGAAPGAQVLAQTNQVASFFEPSLLTLEQGSELSGGGFSPGKRVSLPWGNSGFDINALNANGLTIMKRSIEWATEAGGGASTGPIAHWKFDETSGNTAVDSIGGHDGTLVNMGPSTDWVPGQLSGGLDFDGGNDYVTVPHDDTLSLSTFSISAWIRPDTVSGYHAIMYKGASVSEANYHLYTNADEIVLGLTNGGWQYFVTTTNANLQAGQWYQLTTTFDGASDEVKHYVNGSLIQTATIGASPVMNTGPLVIGSDPYGEDWDGLLDDVRLYDRVLDATEIAALAAGAGPIAHWKLDEISGTTAIDSIGGYNGTLVNMDPSSDWVTGMVSGGLDFDGSNDYIDVSSMNPMSYDDFTVSAWYKSADSSVSDDEYIFEHNDNWVNEVTFGPTDDGTNGRLRFGFSNGGSGTWDPHYGTSDIVDLQWHHVVGVRSSGRIKLYVDGVEETDEADAHAGSTVVIDGDGPFIGDLPGNTEQVHGILDDVRLFDRALSATEIADLFVAGGGSGGGGGGGEDTFRDEFLTAGSYAGDDGSLSWTSDWQEIHETDGPNRGDESVQASDSGYVVRVQDNDGGGEGIQREADLTGFSTALLTFIYWRGGLDNANDYVTIDVSIDGGASWTELDRITGPASDPQSSPQSASYDISSYVAPNTRIRFLTSPDMGKSDRVFLDNIQIEVAP